VAGDYHEGQLSTVMSEAKLTADIVKTWLEKGEDRPTLAFCVDLAHARKLRDQFEAAGVSCGYVDAFTSRLERNEIAEKFRARLYQVVCSVGTLTTGIDWDVRCIILARPTKSEIRYVQIIGEGSGRRSAKPNVSYSITQTARLASGSSPTYTTRVLMTEAQDNQAPSKRKRRTEAQGMSRLPRPKGTESSCLS
jgi:superfamily II DNA or RNA helicase